MDNIAKCNIWFITGSQHLYGPDTLVQVAEHSKIIAEELSRRLPCRVFWKPVVTTPEEVTNLCLDANQDSACIGVITWMHTFSPSKMWIAGLKVLTKPILHLHTQYNREIPWDSIDMDFMNLNQSAHGDREHGYIGARLRLNRKVVAGFWQDDETIAGIAGWVRAAVGAYESRNLKVVRFGDNMREVAVTEGDKVEAQLRFGWSVNTFGIGDLAEMINSVPESAADALLDEYREKYIIDTADIDSVKVQARYEIALKTFLDDGGYRAFTTTFEDLHGLDQLPGLAVQRLMESGYGFGAEGDWKTAALVRIMKVMSGNRGTSFMEDYTYHLEKSNAVILGAHMLEVCPTIASGKPKIQVHPLGIGGKAAPARMVFEGTAGPAVCATIIDMGDRFRMIVNEVEAVGPLADMPKLPVARVIWQPMPTLKTSTEAWIYAGGAHHTCFSLALTGCELRDFAEIMGIEYLQIDKSTEINSFRKELLFSDVIWKLK